MSVDPTGHDLKRFLDEDPGGAVVMLNLLRFKPRGRPSYESYAREIRPFLEKVKAEVLYFGDCDTTLVAPDSHHWDAILLVRYPSRAAFSQMVADPDYQGITGLRTEALEAAVLEATVPWGGPRRRQRRARQARALGAWLARKSRRSVPAHEPAMTQPGALPEREMGREGLEPSTLRLRVSCSAS